MFTRFQASFCKGRSCEDQITQIVQAIEDGFQQHPMQCSILTLLDYSKAYNTVWRETLLLHMLNTGIPLTFITGDMFSSSTSLVPASDLLKVYLKDPSLCLFFSCSTLTILLLLSTMMQLLLSLPMMSLSSPPLVKGKMLKLLPNQ